MIPLSFAEAVNSKSSLILFFSKKFAFKIVSLSNFCIRNEFFSRDFPAILRPTLFLSSFDEGSNTIEALIPPVIVD